MMQEATPTDFNWLATLFAEGGVDTFWLDLDGDLVPDTQISSYTPASTEWEEPFDLDSYNDAGTSPATQVSESEGYEYSEWTSFEVTDADGYPLYDIIDYLPVQPMPTMDWSTSECYFYDPFTSPYDLPYGYEEPAFEPEWYTDPYQVMQADPTSVSDPYGPFDTYTQTDGYSYDPAAFMAYPSFTTYPSYTAPYDYNPSAYTSYDTTSYDMTSSTSYDPSANSWMDASNSYFTDYTFDNQLQAASDTNSFWMNEYSQASDLSNQYWQMSVDASNAGDSSLAYDYNQMSLDANSYANNSWSYADSGYDAMSSADDGWYSAMSGDSW